MTKGLAMLEHRTSTYRVINDEKGWAVTRDGRADPLWRAAERSDALEYGRRVAGNNRPSRLFVHREDGTVESRCAFDL